MPGVPYDTGSKWLKRKQEKEMNKGGNINNKIIKNKNKKI